MTDDWQRVNLSKAIEAPELPGSGTQGAQVVVVSGRNAHVYTWRGSSIAPRPHGDHVFPARAAWVRIGTMSWKRYLEWKAYKDRQAVY